jgi:hypothetical protein
VADFGDDAWRDHIGHADALQVIVMHRHHLARSETLVEQAFDGPQFLHLGHWVTALTKRVTRWLRETITPLPDPQGVFADTRVTLNGSNGQKGLIGRQRRRHEKIVIEFRWFFEMS